MNEIRNRKEVLETFMKELEKDRTKSHVVEISKLGLVEMTRKNVSEGLVESFGETCPACGGRGIILREP
jgi:Rne/Rng family ribonuclease